MALKQYFNRRACTVLLIDDLSRVDRDTAHPEHRPRCDRARADESRIRRRSPAAARPQVSRRGRFAAGTTITPSAPAVSRSIRAWSRPSIAISTTRLKMASGIAEIDALLGGGIEQGTSTLIRRRGRNGEIDAGGAVRRRCGGARREGGTLPLRREPDHAC
jgi:circadian clock protein KaiC